MSFSNVSPADTKSVQRTIREKHGDGVAIANLVTAVVERMMRRYVLERCTGRSDAVAAGNPHCVTWHEATRLDEAQMERLFPYPSLFLYPLPPEVTEHPQAPPAHLLAGGGAVATNDTGSQYREMFVLDGEAPEIMTTVQGECCLSVYSPAPTQANHGGVYLMGIDATSCVNVACRVGLHPSLRRELRAASMQHNASEEVEAARHCCDTFTAAMAHFDTAEGLAVVLHSMLWEVALPAWFHSATHGSRCAQSNECVFTQSHHIVSILQRLAYPAEENAVNEKRSPLLQVEWFIVGGVRCEKYTAPILTALFSTFFSPEGDPGSEVPFHVLRSTFILSELLRCEPIAHADAGAEPSLLLDHRLREDCVCFWSLNTVLRPWELSRDAQLFACCASWGMLLDVGTGGAWPATVCPGTRHYHAATLRHALVGSRYRYMCPLQCEGTLTVTNGPSTHRALAHCGGARALFPCNQLCINLLQFVDIFIESTGTESAVDTRHRQRRCPPILVRRGEWSWNVAFDSLLQSPDMFLLFTSTTPHCEPPDYTSVQQLAIKFRGDFSPDYVFTENTTGILLGAFLR
ncbi:hypothetical protein ERJ75_001752300 [Trypanosoma vivax]|nr:hypothetical protein ERJ75_001752300 [Trypanosoma vivax]